jgi:hypothetical protein
MTHLDEGTIATIRDREAVDAREHSHLEACVACGATLREARERAVWVAHALSELGEPEIDLERARTEIRRRIDERARRDVRHGRWWRPSHLGRAAGLLLLVAGAASALPGSPLRQWIEGERESAVESARSLPVSEGTGDQVAAVSVGVPSDGIRVSIQGAGPLGPIEIVWVDEGTARVEAPAGSRFTYGEGRIEAFVSSGPVRVSLPASAAVPVRMDVGGRPWLRRSAGSVEVSGPIERQTDDRILFAPSAP